MGCEWVLDSKTGTEVCIRCADVRTYEPDSVKSWYAYQDSTYRKPAPYKYSRTTHFRNTLDRIQGRSRIDMKVVDKARSVVQGYPDNYACMYALLKAARLPYQHTNTIRRLLGYDVPSLDPGQKYTINQMFENFCVFYETHKDPNRKNLPSIEYLIYNFLLAIDRKDMADFVTKRYITLEKGKDADKIIMAFLNNYS